jgi:Rrf2 family iron-sulfur cluster assembly transcriptional regulator
MKLVTKNIHYAIKSLLYFALNPARVIPVNELVKKLNMRRAFLRRVLQALSKQGMLRSLKGNGGGFMLNIKPDKLRIIDVLNVFRKETDIIDCLLDKDICLYPKKCLLMREIKKIECQLNDKLRQFTIAKLLESIGKRVGKNSDHFRKVGLKKCG